MKKALALTALVLISSIFLWKTSKSTSFQFFGEIIDRVETSEKVVALTFDDGPTPGRTQQILEILGENEVRATFFLNGKPMEENPGEARLIVEAGHEVGNHSYSHQRMVFKSRDFVAGELERTDKLIREAGYEGPIHFRPPYGKKLFVLPKYLAEKNIKSITWDVAAESYGEDMQDSRALVERTLSEVRPGSIVLMHVMFASRESSMQAVPEIIGGLRNRGYRFVTVSEILEYGNTN